jgi:hypothetical protein
VLRRGRVVARASHAGSARAGVRLVVRAPRRGTLVVRVRATGPGAAATRSATVRARP